MSGVAWYRDREALALIATRHLPWLAGLNLAWEVAQLPLYTLWREATVRAIAFAVAHCTDGDILIGASALVLVLTRRTTRPPRARRGRPRSWL